MEIIYLLAQGDFLKFKEIVSMPATEFLYFGEYLLRKRKVENKKIK